MVRFRAVPRKPRKRSSPPRTPSHAASKTLRRSGGRSYQAHRDWLLAQHGPVCAYCGVVTSPDTITLDHVRPRRGQTAYDRPDNLVLSCATCNAAKADMPFLAFLLARRSRGVYLLHSGDPLSDLVGQQRARGVQISWGTSGHTSQPVPLIALGVGAERFRGYQDNTDFARHLFILLQAD